MHSGPGQSGHPQGPCSTRGLPKGRSALLGCSVEGSQQPLSHLFPFSLPPEPSGSSSSSFYLTLP